MRAQGGRQAAQGMSSIISQRGGGAQGAGAWAWACRAVGRFDGRVWRKRQEGAVQEAKRWVVLIKTELDET